MNHMWPLKTRESFIAAIVTDGRKTTFTSCDMMEPKHLSLSVRGAIEGGRRGWFGRVLLSLKVSEEENQEEKSERTCVFCLTLVKTSERINPVNGGNFERTQPEPSGGFRSWQPHSLQSSAPLEPEEESPGAQQLKHGLLSELDSFVFGLDNTC